jgi:hypothetical protein
LQHAAAALGLPSTVVWNVTKPEIFGYSIHNNVLPEKTYPEGNASSYLFDYDILGVVEDCPYEDYNSIFSIENILKNI